jgi:vitamin B12 transporter
MVLPVLAICVISAARAEDDEPAATIVITAEPLSPAEKQAPTGFVTVIDVADLPEPLETVTDALQQTVGVQVRRFGGLGAFSTISIRGSSSNQVQFYFDGIPLSRGRQETVNVADLPLDGLERIEVYRGITPVTFGAAGIGGVVNLVPKPPSETPLTEMVLAYGSFNTRKVVASHTRRLGSIAVFGHVTYLGSDGDFTFHDDRGTPFNPSDDREATRQNNAFDSVDVLLRAAHDLSPETRVDLTQELYFKDQGVPGIGSRQSLTASFSSLRALSFLRLTRDGLAGGALDAEGKVFSVYQGDGLVDLEGDLGGGPQDRDDRTLSVGGNASGVYSGLPWQAVGWFGEIAAEQFRGENDALRQAVSEPTQQRLRFTLALQDEVTLFDRLLLVPTLRYEHYDDRVSASFTPAGMAVGRENVQRDLFSPSFGAQVSVWEWLQLRGNLGWYERAPNFSELFGNSGNVRGQPRLRSEQARNADVGFILQPEPFGWLRQARLEYAYFNNSIEDLILLVQVSPAVFRPENIGAAQVQGHELAWAATFTHFGIDGNYTHQIAEDCGDEPTFAGKRLPLRPQDQLFVRPQLFSEWVELYYEFELVSGNFLNRSNFDEAPSRDTHTVGINAYPTDWLRLGFSVANLTDNEISDVAGFPLPGRTLSGSVTARF